MRTADGDCFHVREDILHWRHCRADRAPIAELAIVIVAPTSKAAVRPDGANRVVGGGDGLDPLEDIGVTQGAIVVVARDRPRNRRAAAPVTRPGRIWPGLHHLDACGTLAPFERAVVLLVVPSHPGNSDGTGALAFRYRPPPRGATSPRQGVEYHNPILRRAATPRLEMALATYRSD